MELEKKTNED